MRRLVIFPPSFSFAVLLLALLTITLPLQGFAAVLASFHDCCPARMSTMPAAATTTITSIAATHGMGMGMGMDMRMEDKTPPPHHAAAVCDACVTCYGAPACLPAMFLPAPVHDSATLAAVYPPSFPASHIPASLERPPR